MIKADTKTILLADDDEAIVDATVLMFEVMGYEVVHTIQGNNVPEMAITKQPDIVVLDIWMSGIDGRDICRQIKAHPDTRHIPVLMISASRHIGGSALEAGADGFVEKPFEMNTLLDKVEELLRD
ncbi:response regulator [Mucilaginibacter koreensis]